MKLKHMLTCITTIAAVASPVADAHAAVNLLANGSFETGDLSGWSSSGHIEILMGGTGFSAEDFIIRIS